MHLKTWRKTGVQKLCHKKTCKLWSDWTSFTAKGPTTFGYQTRDRKCWYTGTDSCIQDVAVIILTASRVCEGPCRLDYNMTKHGFCLKLGATSAD